MDHVAPGSPAVAAGVKDGDILVELDGQLLVNPEQLVTLIRMHKAGDKVALKILRDGAAVNLTAELGEQDMPVRPPTSPMFAVPGMGAPPGVFPFHAPPGGSGVLFFTEDLRVDVGIGPDGRRELVVLRKKAGRDWDRAEEIFRGPMPEGKALAALPEDVRKALGRANSVTSWWDWGLDGGHGARALPRPELPTTLPVPAPAVDVASLTIRMANGMAVSREWREHCTVKDADGKVVFEGVAPGPKELAALPADVRKALETARSVQATVRTKPAGAGHEVVVEIKEQDENR